VKVAIRIRNLVKKYPRVVALKGINIEVPEGNIYGLLGPNGAGKTTTVNILATLLKPSSGTVQIYGFDVTAQPKDVRRLIDIVPQRLCLDLRLTGFKATHNTVEAEILCDKVGLLNHGLLIKEGSPRTLREQLGVGVLEIRTKEEYLNKVVSIVPDYLKGKVVQIRSTLYVFLDKEDYFETLSAKIRDYCLEIVYRKITLEDVFIKEVRRKIAG